MIFEYYELFLGKEQTLEYLMSSYSSFERVIYQFLAHSTLLYFSKLVICPSLSKTGKQSLKLKVDGDDFLNDIFRDVTLGGFFFSPFSSQKSFNRVWVPYVVHIF